MGFYTETNPVSHSQVVRSVYNPLFCLHLITVILFACMLLIHLEASILCVTVHHDLLQAILFLLAVASCMEKCVCGGVLSIIFIYNALLQRLPACLCSLIKFKDCA